MKNLNKLLYIAPLVFAFGCEPEFDEEFTTSPGEADFSTYVSVGNSLTAGFQSNALRRKRQENSFPAILAEQLKNVGGGAFKQPLLDAGVGIGSSLNAEFELTYNTDCLGETNLGPAPAASQGQIDQFNFPAAMIGMNGPFNNVGIPGAKSFHLLAPGYGDPQGVMQGTANPFYARFVNPQDVQETVISQAAANNHTFFSLWIGNNDVLGYSTGGGAEASDTITATAYFNQVFNGIIAQLTANNAKGVVANIPNITSIPYFTTIPTQTPVLTQAQADALNSPQAYGAYNAGIDQALQAQIIGPNEARLRKISFTAGTNAWVIIDTELAGIPNGSGGTLPRMRQIKSGELLTLTLPQDSLKCRQWGTAKAIPGNYVLTRNEIKAIDDAVASYNVTIKAAANANGLAFVDANKLLSEMENGLTFNGVTYSTEFVTGGAFSLDGVHPNTRGYAIIANAHIDAINSTYGANIPKVDVNTYEGIVFP